MFVRQLYDQDTSTYTYLLVDLNTKEAAIIDSVKEQVDRDIQLIHEMGLTLKYALETHVHADHVTGAGTLREKLGAKVVYHESSGNRCADILAKDGDLLTLGDEAITVLHTPGHTDGDTTYKIEGAVFTGDALLIRGCGRTDFQQGDAGRLYDSITKKIFTLPDHTVIYPGHDYAGRTASTVAEEKRHNPRLGNGKSRNEFIAIMDALDLPKPKRIDVAVPGNMRCGL